jgi:hypothetical protein
MNQEINHDIVREAVNIARSSQVKNIAQLKQKILSNRPGQESEVNDAIKFWSACSLPRNTR